MWLRTSIALLGTALALTVAPGCAHKSPGTPSLPQATPTSAEVAAAARGARDALPELDQAVRRSVDAAFVTTVTVAEVEPRFMPGKERYRSLVVFFRVTAWPASDPALRMHVNVRGEADARGGYGYGGSGSLFALFGDVTALPKAMQRPLVAYLSNGTVAETSTTDVDLTPLWISWKDGSGIEPPVKKLLTSIAAKHGYQEADCVWMCYVTEGEWPQSAHAELLGYDSGRATWALLASRHGDDAARVVEVK